MKMRGFSKPLIPLNAAKLRIKSEFRKYFSQNLHFYPYFCLVGVNFARYSSGFFNNFSAAAN
jgi:hypothetical protein